MSKLEVVRPKNTTIELGGEERVLLMDMNAFALLEEQFGSLAGAFQALDGGAVKDLRILIWIALVHAFIEEQDPMTGIPTKYSLRVFDVGSWLSDMAKTREAIQKVTEVIISSLGKDIIEEAQRAIQNHQPEQDTKKRTRKAAQVHDNKDKGFANVEQDPN